MSDSMLHVSACVPVQNIGRLSVNISTIASVLLTETTLLRRCMASSARSRTGLYPNPQRPWYRASNSLLKKRKRTKVSIRK